MTLASLSLLFAVQGVPARAVTMDATLKDKPYGRVVYIRGIVPGRGLERTVTLEVDDEAAGKYSIQEKRTYATGGLPTSTIRTMSEDGRTITVTVKYDGLRATVTYTDGGQTETETFALENDGATINDPSQFWTFDPPPARNTKVTFWEYSLDANAWVERVVTYTGTAELKVGDKTVRAHRISIGKDTNFYVDDHGMPYKSTQETPEGTLTLVRTSPEIGGAG